MVITTTVMADGYFFQQYPQYPQQFSHSQSDLRRTNPWQLPEKQEKSPEYQQFSGDQGQQFTAEQQSQGRQIDKSGQSFRFVTPEILESLKQQQTQSQLVPGGEHNYRQPSRGGYDYSPYGMGYPDPVYGMPSVSPWGIAPDVMYRGGTYPLMPGIGGITPIPAPAFEDESVSNDSDSTGSQKKYDVFNPYTLLPDGN